MLVAPQICMSAGGIDCVAISSCGAICSYNGPISRPITANITTPSTRSRPV